MIIVVIVVNNINNVNNLIRDFSFEASELSDPPESSDAPQLGDCSNLISEKQAVGYDKCLTNKLQGIKANLESDLDSSLNKFLTKIFVFFTHSFIIFYNPELRINFFKRIEKIF